jgi:hypothetical protein
LLGRGDRKAADGMHLAASLPIDDRVARPIADC